MRTRARRWGNSFAVRIPAALAAESGLVKGSAVDLSVENGRLVVRPTGLPSYSLEELLASAEGGTPGAAEGVRPSNLQGETNWGPPVGREFW